jgi:hypothetical protein
MAVQRRTKRNNKVVLPWTFFVLVITAIGILGFSLKKINLLGTNNCCGNPKTASGEFDPNEKTAYFMNNPVAPLLAELPEPDYPTVLGDVSSEDKWIEVDISDQKLIAWDGNNQFMETLISSGKTGRTPRGEFRIWSKFKYTKMSGGSKENGTYYYLPNVPYTMYFSGSYGIHGTYWHNNFGTPMSHGCVNLPTLAAEKLFYWSSPTLPTGKNSTVASRTNLGTRVIVHE